MKSSLACAGGLSISKPTRWNTRGYSVASAFFIRAGALAAFKNIRMSVVVCVERKAIGLRGCGQDGMSIEPVLKGRAAQIEDVSICGRIF